MIIFWFLVSLIIISISYPLLKTLPHDSGFNKILNAGFSILQRYKNYICINKPLSLLTNPLKIAIVIILTSLLFLELSIPLKVLIIFTALNLVLKENFPFSHYPMYSKFGNETRYIYITDENEKPIPIKKEFRINTEFLKKIYMNEARKIADAKGTKYWLLKPGDLKPAGQVALNYLLKLENKGLFIKGIKTLRLYHVFLSLDNNKINQEKFLIEEKKVC